VYGGGIPAPIRGSPRDGGELRVLADAHKNQSWEDPAALAQYKGDPGKHIYVSKVRWPEGDKIVDAIRVDSVQEQERLVIVYDASTGLGLHISSLVPKGNGNTLLTEYNFVNIHDVRIPWANEPIPQSIQNLHSLHLSGERRPIAPYGLPQLEVTLNYSVAGITGQWASFNSVGTGANPQYSRPVADKTELEYFGPAEFGGLWIGPGAISTLHTGQVLDNDPYTKMTITVSQMDNQSVTITQQNAMATIQHTYDRNTGLLLSTDWTSVFTKSRTSLSRDAMQ
jgi:hypothetical protein